MAKNPYTNPLESISNPYVRAGRDYYMRNRQRIEDEDWTLQRPTVQRPAPPSEPPKSSGGDFWSRLGGYAKDFAGGVGGVLLGTAQAVPRAIKTLGVTARGDEEYRPEGAVEKLLFGEEPVKNLTGAGRDLYSLGATVATGGRDRDAGERLDPLAATLLGTGVTALDLLPGALTTAGTKAGVKTASKRAAEQVREQEFKRMQADMPEFAPSDLEGFIPRKIKVKEQSSAPSIGNAKTVDAQEYDKRFTKLSRAYDRELKAVEGLPEPRRTVTANAVEAKYAQAVDELDRNFGATKVGFKGGRTRSAALEAERPRPTTLTLGSLASRKVAPRTDLPVGQEEYGFMETLRNSPRTDKPLKELAAKAPGHEVRSTQALQDQAVNLVKTNPEKAREVAKEPDDLGIATAQALIDDLQKRQDYGQAFDIAMEVTETGLKLGRGIQAFSIWNRLDPQGVVQYAQRQLRQVGKTLDPKLGEELQKEAQRIKKIEDPEARAIAQMQLKDRIGRAKGSTTGEKVANAWKAGLLTSPITTLGNIVGNVQETAVRKGLSDPIAAIADTVMSKFTGERTKTATLRGYGFGAVKEGIPKGVKYFRTGYDPRRDPTSKWDVKKVYYSDTPAGRFAERYTQGILRLMGAVDQPFYYGAFRNSLEDQALAAAKAQKLKGADREAFVRRFVTEPDAKALERADAEANTAVFQNETVLGSIVGGGKRAAYNKSPQAGAATEAIMPFTQVPSSVATRIITRTPIGTAREVVRQIQNVRKGKGFDQRAMAQAIGEGGAGLALIGAGAALIKAGDINLGYPSDPKEQELWRQEGRQPYSIKIGDTWHSLNYVQPFGAILAMGAGYEQAKKEGMDEQGALARAGGEAMKSVVEQSFLKGLSGALKAINEPERHAESFIENLANSTIPNLIDAIARATDPQQREVSGPAEAFMSTIPGLRQTLPAKEDALGQPQPAPDLLNALFNPFRSTKERQTPVSQELRSLLEQGHGIAPTKPRKDVFKLRDLGEGEMRDLRRSAGQHTNEVWQSIIGDPRYRELSPEQKRKALERAKDDIWAAEKFLFGEQHGLNDDKAWRNLSRAQRAIVQGGRYEDFIRKARD